MAGQFPLGIVHCAHVTLTITDAMAICDVDQLPDDLKSCGYIARDKVINFIFLSSLSTQKSPVRASETAKNRNFFNFKTSE